MRLARIAAMLGLGSALLLGSPGAQARGVHQHTAVVHHHAPTSHPQGSHGTGVESHGYYHSSDGSMVHGPTRNPDPAYGKPSAQCRDGTYSHSHHHQGTCSGHGGVENWL